MINENLFSVNHEPEEPQAILVSGSKKSSVISNQLNPVILSDAKDLGKNGDSSAMSQNDQKVYKNNTCHPEFISGSYLDNIFKIPKLVRNDRPNKPILKPAERPLPDLSGERVRSDKSQKIRTDKISHTIGRIAENVAADYLKKLGHQIIAQNWKTRFCEIDIISARRQTLYFTEVKYRANAQHGDGLAAITPKKLAQIRFAAEIYLAENADLTRGHEIQLSVIALSGNPPRVDEFLENVC